MTNHLELADRNVRELPPLEEEQAGDAAFRAKDLAWSALIDLFERRKDKYQVNYQTLGKRIGRSRKQVQRWLSTSMNMNLTSFGLLAEGLDADIEIKLLPRDEKLVVSIRNYAHPSERAKEVLMMYEADASASKSLINPEVSPPAGSSSPLILKWLPNAG